MVGRLRNHQLGGHRQGIGEGVRGDLGDLGGGGSNIAVWVNQGIGEENHDVVEGPNIG